MGPNERAYIEAFIRRRVCGQTCSDKYEYALLCEARLKDAGAERPAPQDPRAFWPVPGVTDPAAFVVALRGAAARYDQPAMGGFRWIGRGFDWLAAEIEKRAGGAT